MERERRLNIRLCTARKYTVSLSRPSLAAYDSCCIIGLAKKMSLLTHIYTTHTHTHTLNFAFADGDGFVSVGPGRRVKSGLGLGRREEEDVEDAHTHGHTKTEKGLTGPCARVACAADM